MNKMQEKLLEMFKWLVNYLEINNLRYYVIGGTMLGAVRHKGFIPWDDDVDIAMPRKDYEILIEKLSEPIDHYIVESPKGNASDYVYSFAKFYDLNTTMTEDLRKKVTRGIYIDIFPLDGIGNTMKESRENYKKIDKLNMLLIMKVAKIRTDRMWWKNVAVIFGSLLPINLKKITRKIDLFCSSHDFDDYEYVGNLMSTYRSREIMEKRIFGKPTKYEFEGLAVYGPELYDEYLTVLFHDWNKLPPEDKRKSAHDFINIDYEKSYKYISDEKYE